MFPTTLYAWLVLPCVTCTGGVLWCLGHVRLLSAYVCMVLCSAALKANEYDLHCQVDCDNVKKGSSTIHQQASNIDVVM